jgi:hypothetical protein
MPTLNAASLTGLISANLSAANAENLIDAAINRISAHGYEIGNLQGTAGTKTRSVTQSELGWIQSVAIALYPTYQNNGSQTKSFSAGGLSHSNSSGGTGLNASGNPEQMAEQAAIQLSKNNYSAAFI